MMLDGSTVSHAIRARYVLQQLRLLAAADISERPLLSPAVAVAGRWPGRPPPPPLVQVLVHVVSADHALGTVVEGRQVDIREQLLP